MRSGVGIAASTLVLAVLLAGCQLLPFEPFPGGASVQERDGALVITVCEDVQADLASMGARPAGDDSDWSDFWTFENGGSLAAGTELSTDPTVTPPFAGETRRPLSLSPGTSIEILISEDDGPSVHAQFDIGPEGLPESQWLLADGSTSDRPCP